MKSIKKILFIMVALATVLAFVSCSNGSDDGGSSSNNSSNNVSDNNNSSNNNVNDNNSNSNNNNANSGNNVSKPSVVATYEADKYGDTLIFYSDETWELTTTFMGKDVVDCSGTTDWGNPAKNGYVTLTIKKQLDYGAGKLRDLSLAEQKTYEDIQISSGKMYFDGQYFTRQ